jgi:aspartyl protease family protein
VSNVLKFAMVAAVAAISAFASAEAVVTLAPRAPALRAAKAESATILPIRTAAPAQDSVAIPKASDGHYWANGDVNGTTSIRFLVDTGATAVALTPADAMRLGIKPQDLNYGYRIVTAAGQVRAASVKLASITVAGARLDDVDALVIEKGLDTSLLGMTYLGRLSRFEATRQALILQP